MPLKDPGIGIDSSTTGFKVVIMDTGENGAAGGVVPLPQPGPRPSWRDSGNPVRRWLPVVAFALFALAIASVPIWSASARQNPEPDSPRLSPDDKAELIEVLRLKAALGDQVWPGLGQAEIPIILYNELNEFLIGATRPPAPWTAVERDDFGGKPYFRRNSSKPEAFAVRVGEVWAGSVTTLQMMQRKNPIKVGLELHLMFVLHEMFHAYQAGQAPERFTQALKAYENEDRYPFKDAEFAAAWNKEGSLLAAALKASNDAMVRSTVREFLQTRDARRAKAGLSPGPLAFERELEWLEGLAKYVEIRFYELAAAQAGDPAYSRYRPAVPYWLQAEFFRLGSQLDRQNGDLRFYTSGMAQARLLDRLSPGWKDKVMRSGASLEDLLRSAAVPDSPGSGRS